MPETNPDQNQPIQEQIPKPSTGNSKLFYAFLFLIIIIAAIFLINNHKNNSSQNQNSQTTQISPSPTPTDIQSAVEGTSTINSSADLVPGANPGRFNRKYYKNPSLGFELILPDDLKGKAQGTSTVNFINIKTGQKTGSIEVSTSTPNLTLGSLTVTLENNPDVTKISYTTLDSQPSLQFTATTAAKSGIATVYNNRIYYLIGDMANPDITAGFKFD